MRRSFSIFLVLLFTLGPLSAAFDLNDESNLPACCRRHGAHHCAMAMEAEAGTMPGSAPRWTTPATCPYYPGSAIAPLTPVYVLTASSASLHISPAPVLLATSGPAPELGGPSRTHAGRGPPSANLS